MDNVTCNIDFPRTGAVWGIVISGNGELSEGVNVADNMVANKVTACAGNHDAIREEPTPVMFPVTYTNNKEYNWSGETNQGWTDPDRTIETYHQSLGKTADMKAFAQEAINRPLGEFPEEYTAHAINNYVREGFNMTQLPAEYTY